MKVNVKSYRFRNFFKRVKNRLRYPPPLYKKVGGIAAVVIHADGTKDDLGTVSDAYAKRWGVGSGQ